MLHRCVYSGDNVLCYDGSQRRYAKPLQSVLLHADGSLKSTVMITSINFVVKQLFFFTTCCLARIYLRRGGLALFIFGVYFVQKGKSWNGRWCETKQE